MKHYEFSGGIVRRGKESIYVERNEDTRVYNLLKESENMAVITAPRQGGKTSMAWSVGEQLEQEGSKFAFIDFRLLSSFPKDIPESQRGSRWFQGIMKTIVYELKLIESDFNEWWESIPPRTSLTVQFIDFFKNFIREKVKEPMVVVFDEMDRFEEWGYFTDDFFKAIQKLFDERHKLGISFILSAIAHPSLLLKDTITSSFKIGAHFPLPDFDCNEETVKQWIEGLKINNQGIRFDVGKEILTQTGGHPFLTSYLMHRFNEIEGKNTSEISPLINEMVQNAMNPLLGLAIFKAPRDFIVARERYAVTVLEVYKKMLKGPVNLTDIPEKVLAILYTTGLTKLVDNRFLEVRSPIFRRIFDEKWCKRTESGMGTRDWYAPMFIPSYATKDKPNICLINAGGTLGMVEHDNKIVPPQNEEEFFDVYPGLKVIADINYVPSKPKDGANIFPADWTQIARDIFDRRNDGYDGFVIIHGTDTMTYTASAVAFALGPGIKNPVVFVGSQTPYYVRYGDAMVNLARACKIASENIPEVVISFGDEVYRAVRAQKYNDYLFRGFHSPTFKPLAIITEEIEIQKDSLWIDETKRVECKNEFDDRVLQIGQYPGFDPAWLDMLIESGNIKGIIIESLGIGNLPTLKSKYNLLPVIGKAIKEHQIPVIITSRYPINPEFTDKYIPATEPLQLGVISAGNMTSSAALTKLMWLLPQIEKDIKNGDLKEQYKLEEIRKLMAHSYVGEVDKIKVLGESSR